MLIWVLFWFAEYCHDLEVETDKIERDLDPTKSLARDKAALGILRLEACLDDSLGYIVRLARRDGEDRQRVVARRHSSYWSGDDDGPP